MKRIITILLLALSFGANAQFNSTLHTSSNKPYAPNGKPTDARSYYYDGSTFTYRPYASRAEILSYLNTTASRTGSFPIFLDSAGKRYELWFANGTADANLSYKIPPGGFPGGGGETTVTYADSLAIESHPRIAAFGNSLTASYPSKGDSTYPAQLSRMTGYNVVNFGSSGATSTQILQIIRQNPQAKDWGTIFWLGRNNFNDSLRVLNDIDSAVTELGHNRYIILSIINGAYVSELKGTVKYNTLKWVNDSLSRKYGSHFKDVRSYLISQYNPSIPQDVTDFENDVPPSSLRADLLHLNDAGYRKVAEFVSQNIQELERPDAALPARGVAQLFNSPPTIGFIKSNRGFFSQIGVNNKIPSQDIDLGKNGTIGINGVQIAYIPDIATTNPNNRSSNYIFSNGGRNLYDSLGTGIQANANTVLGNNAGASLTVGYRNLFTGSSSGEFTTSGIHNTYSGYSSGGKNISGSENAGFGAYALTNFTTSNGNTGFGFQSLSGTLGAATGGSNSAFGWNTLNDITSGVKNFGAGYNAGQSITSGNYNTITGSDAGVSITAASNNTIYGYFAGRLNTAAGLHAFGASSFTANSTGLRNSGFGFATGSSNTTGNDNTAIGNQTLVANKTGSRNTAVGSNAGYGTANVSDFSDNTLVGYYSGFSLQTEGIRNVFVGSSTGSTFTTGNSNIYIGYNIQPTDVTASSQLNIGNGIFGSSLGTGTTISTGFYGVRKRNPEQAWHIGGQLKIDTVNTGSSDDSVVVINQGVLKKVARTSFSSGGGTSSETLVKPNDTNYTITTGTGNLAIVYFNTLTAERTVTLPDPATNTGRLFSIKHGGDGPFNLNLSVPIYENASTWIVSVAPGAWINFMSDGTQFVKVR